MGKRKRPKEQTTRTTKDTYIYTYVYITRRAGRRAVLGWTVMIFLPGSSSESGLESAMGSDSA